MRAARHHWFISPLFFLSDAGELSQVLRALSHDFRAFEELVPNISDHFGVQGKASSVFFFSFLAPNFY